MLRRFKVERFAGREEDDHAINKIKRLTEREIMECLWFTIKRPMPLPALAPTRREERAKISGAEKSAATFYYLALSYPLVSGV